MKKIGILFDNISRNTGDLAVGLSIKNFLLNMKYSYDDFEELVPGKSNLKNYFPIIIGGGLLIREKGDFFYDKFRVFGKHILNTIGIHKEPKDLYYLENYQYLSVRSSGDKKKINYLKKKINVVPCTTMILKDIKIDIKIKNPSIGIHCFNRNNFNEINLLINHLSKNFNVYLLPITHYNYDYEFLAKLYYSNENNKKLFLLPILSPLEILTIIGKFNYFISYSLHSAYFSYMHNVPFLLLNDFEKMKYFMEDRNLDAYLFKDASDLVKKISLLLNNKIDYTNLLNNDKKIIEDHIYKIKQLLPSKGFSLNKKKISIKSSKKAIIDENYSIKKNKSKKIVKKNYIEYLKKENINLENRIIEKDEQIKNLSAQLHKIQSSKTYKIWQGYCRIMKKLGLKKD